MSICFRGFGEGSWGVKILFLVQNSSKFLFGWMTWLELHTGRISIIAVHILAATMTFFISF